jgi:hypothetical protein
MSTRHFSIAEEKRGDLTPSEWGSEKPGGDVTWDLALDACPPCLSRQGKSEPDAAVGRIAMDLSLET